MESIPVSAPTLVEVARLAGVSRSTASRVLSGTGSASSSTELRVRAAAKQAGYRVNRAARTLRTNRTYLIGVILNNLQNSTFHVVAEVAQRRLAENGYRMILCITGGDETEEALYLDTLAEQRVDGLIIVGSGSNSERLHAMQRSGTAIVNLIRAGDESPGDRVLAADAQGAVLATELLLGLGHRRIAFIGGHDGSNSGRERLEGFLATMDRARVRSEDLVFQGDFSMSFGRDAVRRILQMGDLPTALYLANHEASLGALPELRERKIRIPLDLSIVAHEEAAWFRYWDPPLAVIDNGPGELAEVAVARLMKAMSSKESQNFPREYRIGARLILRESTRPLELPHQMV